MKRNTFFMLIGITGVILVAVLWASIELSMPALIQGAFLIAVLLVYAADGPSPRPSWTSGRT